MTANVQPSRLRRLLCLLLGHRWRGAFGRPWPTSYSRHCLRCRRRELRLRLTSDDWDPIDLHARGPLVLPWYPHLPATATGNQHHHAPRTTPPPHHVHPA